MTAANKRSAVSLPAAQAHRDFEGVVELDGPLTVRATSIRIAAGTHFITRQHALTLWADETLIIDGEAKITSFPGSDEARPLAEPGWPAGGIGIRAGELRGGLLVLDVHGQDGTAGVEGAKGRDGKRGRAAEPSRFVPAFDDGGGMHYECYGGRKAGNGGPGGVGGPGQDGAAGGAGAAVAIIVERGDPQQVQRCFSFIVDRVDPVTSEAVSCNDLPCGGFGGAGGKGGPGGAGGKGGAGTSFGPCPAFPKGKDGKPGGLGQDGARGPRGARGQIVFQIGNS